MFRRAYAIALCFGVSACGGASGGSGPLPSTGGAPASAWKMPAMRPAATYRLAGHTVRISEIAAPAHPQYIAQSPTGVVYFGSSSGDGGLWRYSKGSFSATQPASNAQNTPLLGNVDGLSVSSDNTVVWATSYVYASQLFWFRWADEINCGGDGTATLCAQFEELQQRFDSVLTISKNLAFATGGNFDSDYQTTTFEEGDVLSELPGRKAVQGTPSGFLVVGNANFKQVVAGAPGQVWALQETCPYTIYNQFIYPMCGPPYNVNRLSPTPASFSFPPSDTITSITWGRDHDLWFTDATQNSIGRLDPRSGHITMFPLAKGHSAYGIVAAPDTGLWFSDVAGNEVGRMELNGEIREFPIPTPNANPGALAVPTNPNCYPEVIWFGEGGPRNAIGEIVYS